MAKTWNTRCEPHLIIPHDVLQRHDIDILAAISAFPQIAAGINGDLTIVHFGEFAGYDDVRGWKSATVDTDSLQRFQTLLSNTVVSRDNVEGL